MYYEFDNIFDLDVKWDKYHIRRKFNDDLIITTEQEKLVFNTRDYIQTLFLRSSVHPIIICLSLTRVKTIRFGGTWFEKVIEHYSPVVLRKVYFYPYFSDEDLRLETGRVVDRCTHTTEHYKVVVTRREITCLSNNKIFKEWDFRRMFVSATGILYLRNNQWIQFTFDGTISYHKQLNFDQIDSSGLYSAINPVSGYDITICDLKCQNGREFGYLGESWLDLRGPTNVGSRIYSSQNEKITIFQPVTCNNWMYLASHVKDYITFLYWLIKQQLATGYMLCYYMPKCLVNKYVLKFT